MSLQESNNTKKHTVVGIPISVNVQMITNCIRKPNNALFCLLNGVNTARNSGYVARSLCVVSVAALLQQFILSILNICGFGIIHYSLVAFVGIGSSSSINVCGCSNTYCVSLTCQFKQLFLSSYSLQLSGRIEKSADTIVYWIRK